MSNEPEQLKQQGAARAVTAVIKELQGRKGFAYWWDKIEASDKLDILECAQRRVSIASDCDNGYVAKEKVFQAIASVLSRVEKERISHEEQAAIYERSADMHGWNFHSGKAAGMTQIDLAMHELKALIEKETP